MRLKDKIAIVTGGGSGIGEAISKKLASEGANVVVADIKLDAAENTVKEIIENNGKAFAFKVDITNFQEVKRLVDTTKEKYKRVDILVNNAGWDKVEPFLESSERDLG